MTVRMKEVMGIARRSALARLALSAGLVTGAAASLSAAPRSIAVDAPINAGTGTLGLGRSVASGLALQPPAAPFTLDGFIQLPRAGEVLDLAVDDYGSTWVLITPLGTRTDFPTLHRIARPGFPAVELVVRNETGRELRPRSFAPAPDGGAWLTTGDRLVRIDAGGATVWDAPAGDGHVDFGPAARGLSLAPSGDLLWGADKANGRIVAYDVGTGALRRRLGTQGTAPGSYLAPLGVDFFADGRMIVADHGNRRLQVLDSVGNPLERWPVPGRPTAVEVTTLGDIIVGTDAGELFALDPAGKLIWRFEPASGPRSIALQHPVGIAEAPDGRILVADRGAALIQVWLPGDSGLPTSSPTPGASPTPTVPSPTPTPAFTPFAVAACPDAPAHVILPVRVPSSPPAADILFVVDTTGSMETVVSTLAERTLDIVDLLRAEIAFPTFGLLDVRDHPYGRAGVATDRAWLLRTDLTTDAEVFANATRGLWSGGGGDAPEAYAGALAAAIESGRISWRPGARRIVVLIGDSVPRDDDLNEGISSPPVPGVWTPGEPLWWRDSGLDWAPGSADDIDWQRQLEALNAAEVTLMVVVTGTAPDELFGRTDHLTRYWREWAGRTMRGGTAVELSDASALAGTLIDLIGSAGRRIATLSVGAEAPYELWAAATPPTMSDLDVPPTGLDLAFDVSIQAPVGTADGLYRLVLVATGDGARYATMPLALDWREECIAITPGTPSPTSTNADATSTGTATPTPTASSTVSPTGFPSSTRTPTPRPTAASSVHKIFLPQTFRAHCAPTARPKADIAVVIDTSSSMAGAKLEAALEAALTFVDLIALPRDRAAIIFFDGRARIAQPLTSSRSRLQIALVGASTGLGTRIDLGLGAALDELAAGGTTGTTPVVVLLTDGRPDGGSESALDAAAARARSAGVTVFTIGLGADADESILRRVATDPSRYIAAPDGADLRAIYANIAGAIPCE